MCEEYTAEELLSHPLGKKLLLFGFGEQYGGNEGLAHQLRVYLATQERTLQQQGCTEVDVSDFLDYALKLDQEWPAEQEEPPEVPEADSCGEESAEDGGGGDDETVSDASDGREDTDVVSLGSDSDDAISDWQDSDDEFVPSAAPRTRQSDQQGQGFKAVQLSDSDRDDVDAAPLASRQNRMATVKRTAPAQKPPAGKKPRAEQAVAACGEGNQQKSMLRFLVKRTAGADAAASPATPRQPLRLVPASEHHRQQQQQQQHRQQQQQPRPHNSACSRALNERERSMDLPDLVNLKVFGNASFRHRQRQVVDAVLAGRSAFVLMPTGGGKSLCFQLPAVMSRGVTVVVSPLLSLMQDQVAALCRQPSGGVPATFLSSQQSKGESDAVYNELRKDSPTCKLLYVTPEQFCNNTLLQELLVALRRRQLFPRLVIDEAHCVSTWGHDFRKDYQQIGGVVRERFGGLPITALTATATARVQADVKRSLGMEDCVCFQVPFYRPNLHFSVVKRPKRAYEALVEYIWERFSGAKGIIYCFSKNDTVVVASFLHKEGGIKAAPYHGGMTSKDRIRAQNAWQSGHVKVIVATIAFGMGIDAPDVRFVVHHTLSKSVEGYYQEAGRAGRDGRPSECVLLYARADIPRLIRLQRGKPAAVRKQDMKNIEEMQRYCDEESVCRHAQLITHFGDANTFPGGRCGGGCDNCLRADGGDGSDAEGGGFGWGAFGDVQEKPSSRRGKSGARGRGKRSASSGRGGVTGGGVGFQKASEMHAEEQRSGKAGSGRGKGQASRRGSSRGRGGKSGSGLRKAASSDAAHSGGAGFVTAADVGKALATKPRQL